MPTETKINFEKLHDTEQKNLIIDVLEKVQGNKKQAAKQLGMHFSTLHRRIKKLNIEDIIPQGKNGRPSLVKTQSIEGSI